MSRLFIANVTRQTHIVCYRLDFDSDGNKKDTNRRFEPAKQQEVPAGRQVQIGGDFHPHQITDIVDQLSRYGLVGCVNVPRLDNRVHPLIFNIDKAVPAKLMEQVRDHNEVVQTREGQLRRKKAAVATNDIVQQEVKKSFTEHGIDAAPADTTEVTFEQEEQSEAGEKRIEEGFRIEPARAKGKGKAKKR